MARLEMQELSPASACEGSRAWVHPHSWLLWWPWKPAASIFCCGSIIDWWPQLLSIWIHSHIPAEAMLPTVLPSTWLSMAEAFLWWFWHEDLPLLSLSTPPPAPRHPPIILAKPFLELCCSLRLFLSDLPSPFFTGTTPALWSEGSLRSMPLPFYPSQAFPPIHLVYV